MENGRLKGKGAEAGLNATSRPGVNVAGSGPFSVHERIMFGGGVTHLSCMTVGRTREGEWQLIDNNKRVHFALQFKDLRRLSCGFLRKEKRQDVGVSEDLQAAWWLLADGAGGGVVRIVTISDWFSTRVGMTRKYMGSGSISYCCFQISHSF